MPGGGSHPPYVVKPWNGGYAVYNSLGERKNKTPMSKAAAEKYKAALFAAAGNKALTSR